ncbi:D-tagatose-bisphosphate aldolase, class II, non-catalytic subunit [Roseinatronobacter alkalisoli]|uniref:D-tagatose-bisphosphate aldolase, class II, non-catalytic subunit n=1 Tax=Roseinatronobacter alkalisoli TaxID=3028235 RepID=A0ABT5TA63_9RHOB|nr:D-tagatose-bisphosphate aldolase, class II, non-catalytic subunit [Roseinatronobacter sp. HJB301]MDD7972014.1 D-tagatose-bisphosphate aldolase, class II, non-catalytic subunit [Roseinatronobacter sp. HJB301]
MTTHPLADIATWAQRQGPRGIPSVCSAHPFVLEAAMRATLPSALPLLIEATCNQVNQEGGYTGMTPQDFRDLVDGIAERVGFPQDRLILGGDHLGPNPWKALPSEQAMQNACVMIAAYVRAGFTKLHLDCSMGCAGEPVALDDQQTADRAARLAAAAEAALPGAPAPPPVYIIGTEVPIPGGAMEEPGKLAVTTADAALATVEIHRKAFVAAGLDSALRRVIGLVVQPGVEFGNHNVIDYDPNAARALSAVLPELPGMVFEAHSTDYQTPGALAALVRDGFAILKVGPGLTFALREALYGLDQIATELFPNERPISLRATMERVLLDHPEFWQDYYKGTADQQRLLRHFSLSDRIRYAWPMSQAETSVSLLLDLLGEKPIPDSLVSQYLGRLTPQLRAGTVGPNAKVMLLTSIENALEPYIAATQ